MRKTDIRNKNSSSFLVLLLASFKSFMVTNLGHEIFRSSHEARINGARLKQACNIAGITDRTYERRLDGDKIKEDQRPYADRPEPVNKLTKEEYNSVIKTANSPEFVELPPSQIVSALAVVEYISLQNQPCIEF